MAGVDFFDPPFGKTPTTSVDTTSRWDGGTAISTTREELEVNPGWNIGRAPRVADRSDRAAILRLCMSLGPAVSQPCEQLMHSVARAFWRTVGIYA